MLFLIGQIAFFLLIAAIEGIVIGWLIARYQYSQKMVDAKIKWDDEFKDKKLEMAILQNVLNKKVMEITTLQQKLHECQKNYIEQKNKSQNAARSNDNPNFTKKIFTQYKCDNLKEISGIGHFIEKKLNELGIISISQIASWKHTDVEKFAQAIGPFPDRIRRDNWVGKAKEIISFKALT